MDSAALKDIDAQLAEAQAKLNSPEVMELKRQINSYEESLLNVNRQFTFAKSRGDEAYYFWKKSVHEGTEDVSYKKRLQENEVQMAQANAHITELTTRHDSLAGMLAEYTNAVKALTTKRKDLFASIELAKSKIERARSSTISIRQVMKNNFDHSNFGTPKARIDRCQTCHAGWKDETMAEAKQPFTQHPVPELLKIHNPEVFGCTPCHRGQGTALTAGMAHGNEDHYWEWPLLQGKAPLGDAFGGQRGPHFPDEIAHVDRLTLEGRLRGGRQVHAQGSPVVAHKPHRSGRARHLMPPA